MGVLRKRAVQLTLESARRPVGLGGWRPGAGRPRGHRVSHGRRARFAARFPLHVTLRVVDGLPSLRTHGALRVVQRAIARFGRGGRLRVVEYAVIGNHVHLIVESLDAEALARGMQALEVSLARRLNRLFERRGTFFAERYHARVLRTPREVRGALRYVLLNHRHHQARRGERLTRDWIDPFSSGYWFDGWRDPVRLTEPRQRELLNVPQPTAAPTVWLLTTGWRRWGPLAFDEIGAKEVTSLGGR
jgi:REP element-mobilizing transposase RayT